jgi:hypothetical protein
MATPRDNKVTRLSRYHWDSRAATFDDEPGHGLHSQDEAGWERRTPSFVPFRQAA